MRYELRLTAFDMLDQVHVSGVLYKTEDLATDAIELVWANSGSYQGEGCTEAKEWTREALLWMLEDL